MHHHLLLFPMVFLTTSIFQAHAHINTSMIDEIFTSDAKHDHSVAIVEKWLKNHHNINATNQHRQTLLIKAVIQNDKALIRFLIHAGINVNAIDVFGKTALDYASEQYKKSHHSKSTILLLTHHQAHFAQEHNSPTVDRILQKRAITFGAGACISLGVALLFFASISIEAFFIPVELLIAIPALTCVAFIIPTIYWTGKAYERKLLIP